MSTDQSLCRQWAQQDLYDIMGFRTYASHHNACYKERLSWFDPSNIRTVSGDGTFILYPYEEVSSRLKAIKIPLQTVNISAYYLEYRTGTGFDQGISNLEEGLGAFTDPTNVDGIIIHGGFFGDNGNCSTTYLLDVTPESRPDWPSEVESVGLGDTSDSFLLPGMTFVDPNNGLSIHTNRIVGDGIEVAITFNDCGDGNIDPGEQCDDSNRQNGDGCNSQCMIEVMCHDSDSDGYYVETSGCQNQPGFLGHDDCNDNSNTIYPNAQELCDTLDNDCSPASVDGSEEPTFGEQTTCGVGDCRRTGTMSCIQGSMINSCVAGQPLSEMCDAHDNDCDGLTDEGLTNDADADGFTAIGSCQGSANDCDDSRSTVNPGIVDSSCNNVDNDCDGTRDEDYTPTPVTCGVGICSGNTGIQDCRNGIFTDNCNPFAGAVSESCVDITGYDSLDNNCDGTVDLACDNYCDQDGDGYSPHIICALLLYPVGDCNDALSSINPGAQERCDGIDNDCDTQSLDGTGESTFGQSTTCGIGQCRNTGTVVCTASTLVNTCTTLPSSSETCDGIDNNCNGISDEGGVCLPTNYYCDTDGDSFYSLAVSGTCTGFSCIPTGCRATIGTDCADSLASINPAAADLCDSINNDCNIQSPDGSAETWYNTNTFCGVGGCSATGKNLCIGGRQTNTCSPLSPAIETCNSIDDDCDGTTDENVMNVYYLDSDHDLYGNLTESRFSCFPPADYVINHDDCHDSNPSIHPGTVEVCNNLLDDNCNTLVDTQELSCQPVCTDVDSDGYCLEADDCDDLNSSIHPGSLDLCNNVDDDCDTQTTDGTGENQIGSATTCGSGACHATGMIRCDTGRIIDTCMPGLPLQETCNNIDDNCDEEIDGLACPLTIYYCDLDQDGHYSSAPTGQCSSFNCVPTNCRNSPGRDCNDTTANVHPGNVEICTDLVDNNCKLLIDARDPLCELQEPCTTMPQLELPSCVVATCSNDNVALAFNNSACADNNTCTIDLCTPGGCRNAFNEEDIACLAAIANCTDSDLDGFYDYNSVSCPGGQDTCIQSRANLTLEHYHPRTTLYNISFNANDSNVTNISNFRIFKEGIVDLKFLKGMNLLRAGAIGCFEPIYLDTLLHMDTGIVSVDTTSDIDLNSPAQITFYDIHYQEPAVLMNGIACSTCTIITYTDGQLIVDVPGFSTYEIIEGYVAPEASPDGGSPGGGGRRGGSARGGAPFTNPTVTPTPVLPAPTTTPGVTLTPEQTQTPLESPESESPALLPGLEGIVQDVKKPLPLLAILIGFAIIVLIATVMLVMPRKDNKLEQYITSCMDRGFTSEQIVIACQRVGWKKEIVTQAIQRQALKRISKKQSIR